MFIYPNAIEPVAGEQFSVPRALQDKQTQDRDWNV
jgi:hypothetical protein